MITRITGKLVHLTTTEATLGIGAFEYQVLIPEFVRRQLQPYIDQEVSLRTIQFYEGNLQQGKLTPRMIGFMTDAEREFFDAICSVDGVGVKKALRAMIRPVKDVAVAIEEQNLKELSTLPGIGTAMAERIVAKLRRKMAKFALIVARDFPADSGAVHDLLTETYEALLSLGHTSADARQKIDTVTDHGKKKFKSVEDLLAEIYSQKL